ncbi:MAG: peptide-methionine (R)-S-oxide reductase MsrB [Hyphomonadaceae bacterium]|nr:peptide-methionine (R)-S-oxide reductase MsrB [Hyphomonadaceae bacterium]
MTASRRTLLLSVAALAVAGGGFALAQTRPADGAKGKLKQADVNRARFAESPWRRLSADQWRARLSPAAFAVLRQEDTERPGTSPLNEEKRRGTYVCAGCALPLFRSEDKYESGTGWPSFMRSIPGALGTKQDFVIGYPRTEYHCAQCLGHQGHVFDDGPAPTGLRYCNNGVALRFIPT